ncbi:hypothetical protein [Cellulomonas sp. P5_C5]
MDTDAQYQVVAQRRMQWDNLVWQVPLLSLTAQAFLFAIVLGRDTTSLARVDSGLLSFVVTVLSITLMARHRQAEIADAHWLEEYEKARFGASVHGESFRAARDKIVLRGRLESRVPMWPQFRVWIIGMSAFGLVAAVVVVLSIVQAIRGTA